MAFDPRIDDYIQSAAAFAQPMLVHIRDTVHQACPQVEETIKWGMPTFMHAGGILCGMAAFKKHVSFGYWKHALVVGDGAGAGDASIAGCLHCLRHAAVVAADAATDDVVQRLHH